MISKRDALLLVLVSSMSLAQSRPSMSGSGLQGRPADPMTLTKVSSEYGKLPLSFEENVGQADPQVKFLSRGSSYSVFLTEDQAVFTTYPNARENINSALKPGSLPGSAGLKEASVLRMKLVNSNVARVTGEDRLPGVSNYFIGNDPTKWYTNVSHFQKVNYENVYPGIDLVYYSDRRQLEYDFVVAPHADPSLIRVDLLGARRIFKDNRGDLVFKMRQGEVRWRRPFVYQEKGGTRQSIAASYQIGKNKRVGFRLAKYDAGRPLYIDPLIFSTYLGGNSADEAVSIAVDTLGNAYLTGSTNSTNFPVADPLQSDCPGGCANVSAFVSKLAANGSALVYSTYLGGIGGGNGNGIAVDASGDAYVTGTTNSTNFPTMNAFQRAFGGGDCDAFLAEINPTGSALVYSTYLGGSGPDFANAIAVDTSGNAYLTGTTSSSNFPTANALQPTYAGGGYFGDAFVTKFNTTGSALVYSTYLGGSGYDLGYGIAADGTGSAYVTGYTDSTDFPTANAFQPNFGGTYDAFVTKITPSGSALVYSTFLGGSSGEVGAGIAVDSSSNAYVTGYTSSSDFPTANPFQATYGGNNDGFLTKFDNEGSGLVYSTYLGGSENDGGVSVAVDSSGDAYVAGYTYSANFPTLNAIQPINAGSGDVFVTEMGSLGSALVYSTYLGGDGEDNGMGIAVNSLGNAFLTGATESTNFPTINPFQSSNGGGYDAFVSKLPRGTETSLLSSANPSTQNRSVTFTAAVSSLSGAPTGKVQFLLNGGTVLAVVRLTSGSAKYTTSTLLPGIDVISAAYQGDADDLASTSPGLDESILAMTTTTLGSSPNPSSYEQAVTFSASVSSSIGAPPDGETITFKQGTTVLGTGTLSSGTATLQYSALGVGAKAVKAAYSGDASFAGSASETDDQIVSKASTTTGLVSSLNPSNYEQSVTFTATVTPAFGGMPTGTVVFKDGSTTLKSVPLSAGVANYTTTKLAVGSHNITATYNGSADFTGSSAGLTQVVQQ